MGPYLGDYAEDATLDFIWDTHDADGASITRATDGTVSVYKANGTTQSTAGVTDTEDFDSLTGIHHLRIDLSADAFYATGNDYNVVLSAATVDGQSVNAVLCSFSIENRSNEVNVTQISGDSTAADNLELDYDGTGYAKANSTIGTCTANTDMRGTDSAALASVCTEARMAALDAANLPSDVNAILLDTNELQTDDVPGLIAALNDVSSADVNAACDTAIETYRLDELMTAALGSQPAAGSLFGDLTEDDSGTQRFTVNALENGPTGEGASAETIADAVWDEVASGHTGAGTFGAQCGTDIDAILADTNELQTDDVPGLIGALNDPTAAEIADQVWDEAKAGHTDVGSFGEEVQSHAIPGDLMGLVSSAITSTKFDSSTAFPLKYADTGATEIARTGADGDTLKTLSDQIDTIDGDAIADAVWDEAASGHVGAGTFGAQCGTDIDAILVDTNEMQGKLPSGTISDFDETSDPVELLDSGGTAGTSAAELVDDIWEETQSDHTTADTMGGSLNDAGQSQSPQAIADAVWDETMADHTGALTTGGYLNNAGSGASADVIADAVWDEARSGHTSAGTFGQGVASVQGVVTGSVAEVATAGMAKFCSQDTGETTAALGSVAKLAQGTAGTVNVTLGAVVGTTIPANRTSSPITLEMFQAEAKSFVMTVNDADGDPVDLSALTLRFVVYDENDPPTGVFDVEDGTMSKAGDDHETVTIPVSSSQSANANRNLRWILWNAGDEEALLNGSLEIKPAVTNVA